MRRLRHSHGKKRPPFHGEGKLSLSQQETLEQIWRIDENGKAVTSEAIKKRVDIPHLGQILEELASGDFIKRSDGKVTLSEKGRKEAAALIRRNRLAEVLFTQIFDVAEDIARDIACKFEHIAISDDVADTICTFLGHPPASPDGRPIPPGACCAEGRSDMAPMVKSLTEMQVGETGKVAFIRPSEHSLLDRLSSYGIVPGTELRLHQKKPSLVVIFDGTTLALEKDIAKDIYIRTKEEK